MPSSLPLDISLPRSLVAGDSLSLLVADVDHPFGTWTGKLAIGADTPVVINSSDGGSSQHLFAITTTITGAIPHGQYGVTLVFTNAGDSLRETRPCPSIYILPNPLAGITPSWAQATLTLVESALQKIGKATNASVSINGETYTKTNLTSLLSFRDRLINQVAGELAAMGKPIGNAGRKTVVTRFRS